MDILDGVSFDNTVQDMDLAVIDFYADWCGPCKAMTPLLEQLHQEGAPIFKVDSDASPELAARFNVRSIPTLVFLRQGVEAGRLIGAAPLAKIREAISNA